MGRQQLQIDRARQCELERPDFAALDGGSPRPSSERAFVTLLEERIHALAELGQLRLRTLAQKEIPAEPGLQVLYGAGQRRLRHVAAFRRFAEIQLADGRQEISALMHLHSETVSIP